MTLVEPRADLHPRTRPPSPTSTRPRPAPSPCRAATSTTRSSHPGTSPSRCVRPRSWRHGPRRTWSRRCASPRRHGLLVTPQATGHGPIAELVGAILVNTQGLDECIVHPEGQTQGWARVGAGVKWIRVVRGRGPLRPGTPVGLDHRRGHRRLHHRRWPRTDGPHLRPGHRPGPRDRGRDRRRRPPPGDTDRTTPSCSSACVAARGCSASSPRSSSTSCTSPPSTAARCGSTASTRPPSSTGGGGGPPDSPRRPPRRSRCSSSRRCPTYRPSSRSGSPCRSATSGPVTPPRVKRWFAAMREAAPVLLDDVALKPYTEVDSVHTDPLDPLPAHEAAAVLTDFPAEAADALLALTGPASGSPQVLVEVRQMGGAVARRGAHESAFCSRDAAYSLLLVGIAGTPGMEAHGEAVLEAMRPVDRGPPAAELHVRRRRTTSTPTTRRRWLAFAARSGPTTRTASWPSGAHSTSEALPAGQPHPGRGGWRSPLRGSSEGGR